MFKNSDLILKIVSSIIAVVTIAVGLYEYHSNNDREFRSNFFKQQNQVYEQLLDDLGVISSSLCDTLKTEEFTRSKKDFDKIYFGKLNLYQNNIIETNCDTLYDMITEFRDSFDLRNPDSIESMKQKIFVDSIQSRIYFLAQECKTSLQDTYQISK